jgi:predicted nucleic acid-binding protein
LIVVSDAGPLIHLSLVRSLGLLREIYGRILIPELVYNEVVKKGEGLAGSTEVAEANWIEAASHSPESDLFRLLRTHLDGGETAAICLAVDRKAQWILSDDRPARQAAEALGFQIKGTIGILVMAKREGLVPAAAPLLRHLQDSGVWLAEELVAKALQSLGERPEE